ncbi:YihY family inner membrane protein [Sulfuricella sp.]|uniref:YihY family inner membrane protein n=1 Tax=Sulfuricella sp. TaxID=2099377 RepID=UPI002C9A8AB9|nr:YihY family inner membrane protein [Sulfuricella sp.]HUX64626.1 YihY family inner membrane protein [Sulfuricella sp.]
MVNNFSRVMPFLLLVRRRFKEDRCAQFAASLTYTTLLALVPIVTIALTVLSAFPVFTDLMTQLKVFILGNFVPISAGKIISVYMQQFAQKAAHLTALGIGLLAVTAFVLMLTIDHAFDVIWRVRRKRPLLRRFLIYWAALTLGPLLIGVSLSLTSYLVSFPLELAKGVPAVGMVTLKIVPVALTIFAFALLYRIVPSRPVLPLHALVGGMAAGIAFELMKKVFALYVTHFSTYTLVYGAFASVPLFLIWIYLSWLVVLSGAVIAAALPYWNTSMHRGEEVAGRGFFAALAVLKAIYQAHRAGETLSLQRLLRESDLGLEDIEDILDRLNEVNWVGSVEGGGWTLTRSAEAIRLADVYRVFVFDPDQGRPAPGVAGTRAAVLLTGLTAKLDEALSLSLKELFSPG